MFRNTVYTLSAALLLTATGLQANAVTFSSPVELAKKQEILSQKIAATYSKHKDISGMIHRLEEQQNRLKKSIHDPEINNMIDFLQLCLENIKVISLEPRSLSNIEKIADLGASINEGSRYIVRKLN